MINKKLTVYALTLQAFYEDVYKEVKSTQKLNTNLIQSLNNKFLTTKKLFKLYKELNCETYCLLFQINKMNQSRFESLLKEKEEMENSFISFLKSYHYNPKYINCISLFENENPKYKTYDNELKPQF